MPLNVTKYSGDKEPFDKSKLRKSLVSAGANPVLTGHIANQIREKLYEGITTEKIYKEAFRLLRSESERSAGRYRLKESLFELGPSGYPFAKFVAELLERLGYKTDAGITLQGECVSHEIDVIAQNDDAYLLVECKFNNRSENRCNVKVPLYIQSRFLDLKRSVSTMPAHKDKIHKGWVVTNTRFTSDAEKYGACVGLKLLSWDFPRKNGIKDLITYLNLYPVTCLSHLTKEEKRQLLSHEIIFCKQICEDKKRLEQAGINPRQINRIVREANEICNNGD
ncbi:MAG: restriction endonuclease [Balneolaceae bacterium]